MLANSLPALLARHYHVNMSQEVGVSFSPLINMGHVHVLQWWENPREAVKGQGSSPDPRNLPAANSTGRCE